MGRPKGSKNKDQVKGTRWTPGRVPLDKILLEDLYFNRGMTLAQVAAVTNTNCGWVRKSLKHHGLVMRTKSEALMGHVMSDVTKAKIGDDRRGRIDSLETIAKKRAVFAPYWGWSKGLTADTDPRVAKLRDSVTLTMRTPEQRERVSILRTQQIQSGTFYSRGHHDSPKVGRVYYMSGWELRRWKELDEDPQVLSYKVQPCTVRYDWDGIPRRYTPDALIQYADGTIVLEEIKPEAIIEHDRAKKGRITAKLEAGRKYALEQGWVWRVFWYEGR